MSDSVLTCRGLTKSYVTGRPILNNFDIDIPKGKIVGLLGPNGCGKSTLLKLVMGLLTPDSGEILIAGEPRSEKTNAYVSYLSERTYLNSAMRVDEIIAYFADFFSDFDVNAAYEMLKNLDIDTTQKLSVLSKGTREKVQLVMVMARRCKLYLLDEPIAGVDPAARDYILKTIIGNYNPEATVIITTHLIYDVEPVLDEFYFLSKGGRIVACGAADAVREDRGQSLDELFKEVFKC
jgi:ABC-2 type transport system ATP-binding protein